MLVDTGGATKIIKHSVPASLNNDDTQVLPDAGFDDVGLIMVTGVGTEDAAETTVYGTLSIGSATTVADQRGIIGHRESSTTYGRSDIGDIIRIRSSSTDEYLGNIDGVNRQPTMTWPITGTFTWDLGILYVETAPVGGAPPREAFMML
jgi:hypothetical protein